MAAFDPILSGYPGMDQILDHIRLGDNVVWQVSSIEEFRLFAQPFARQAVADGRNIVYIRFAQHAPVLTDLTGIDVCQFDPEEGFETFTVKLHDEITRRGRDAFYVFDCLSELQSAWYTDLMMGNFFRVTCPYLFELDTVAYFPLIRGRHSFDAVARIRDTTQLLLDVCSSGRYVYLHPLKVWNRYSNRMFLPHCYDTQTGEFSTVQDGVGTSRYYQVLQRIEGANQDQNYDSYDRFFHAARMEYAGRSTLDTGTESQLIDSMMTRDDHLRELVHRYFTPRDYFALRDRMIGSGAIGGKACGMLLARKIAETELSEDMEAHSEPHDSWYIGSDVFYTFIVSNDCWRLRIRQRTEAEYFTAAEELKQRLLTGTFPAKLREQFLTMLEYFGQSPIIVRSSSFLEDGFHNAFAGKYESVFCVNQGSPQDRLEAFEQAVRRVYASTMDRSALEYRRLRGLEDKDEQMAILVQRVSGSWYGQYFMPSAAGVGYSHSAYKWYRDMDPAAGMLRLVMGLGTRAVDRTREDYPRLANLDRPAATLYTTSAQKHRFSQHWVDALDRTSNQIRELPADLLLPFLPRWYLNQVMEHDWDAESLLRQRGSNADVLFVSCQRLLENPDFALLMRRLLKTLERVYESPVDIEYAINLDASGDFVLNLLQCRPLYLGQEGESIDLSTLSLRSTLFDLSDSSMGPSGVRTIDAVVFVDPELYYRYPYARKYDVATAVGRINHYFKERSQRVLLLTPGRIGTSSPELGVPVSFADIVGCTAVCEVSDARAGYQPELSYGSHMFQDLVESEILYCAIWNNQKTRSYDPHLLLSLPNLFSQICPDSSSASVSSPAPSPSTSPFSPSLTLADMIHVSETPGLQLWQDAVSGRAICGWL